MHSSTLTLASVLLAFASCLQANTQAISVEHGTARCTEMRLPADHRAVCEVSAVSRVGERLYLANDKPMGNTGASPLFDLALEGERIAKGPPTYLQAKAFTQARKFEAMTTTLDDTHVIAITSFSRIGSVDDATDDAFNTLLYWPVHRPQDVKLVSPSTRKGVTSSFAIREQLVELLGAPFFQIEGLSIAPANQLLLGVRKVGASYGQARDVFKILAVPFAFDAGEMHLTGAIRTLFEFTPEVPGSDQVLGLASLEFDRFHGGRLYALTSFEDATSIAGYLWSIPLLDGSPAEPQLVIARSGEPLRFNNKPEGLEVLDASTLLVVHDDDRFAVQSSAQGQASGPDEFAYSIVHMATDR
ncbi:MULTISPECIES: hypothetical protein [unclassified Pseudomonas]|uniref:hypothetical protein n=1 Tax=unclassified Pseudomonas TaxID=196821 RepID=UPI0035C06AB1